MAVTRKQTRRLKFKASFARVSVGEGVVLSLYSRGLSGVSQWTATVPRQ